MYRVFQNFVKIRESCHIKFWHLNWQVGNHVYVIIVVHVTISVPANINYPVPLHVWWFITSIFDKVPLTFTWLAYWHHGVTRDCKWSTMTLQVASLIRRSSRKQHGTENNRSWLSTCSQVIRSWRLKVQHGKPCHTLKKLDVSRVRFPSCQFYLSKSDVMRPHHFHKVLKTSVRQMLQQVGGTFRHGSSVKLTIQTNYLCNWYKFKLLS